MKCSPEIHSSFEVDFADDHLNVTALKIRKGMPVAQVQKLILDVGEASRSMLDSATRSCGFAINKKKSEMVVMEKYANPDLGLKSNFTWLGYSLELKNNKHVATHIKPYQTQTIKHTSNNAKHY